MRTHRLPFYRFISLALFATAIVGFVATRPTTAEEAPKPRPYKAVPIEVPQPVKDPSFVAFRKQIASIAQRKDRAALAKLIAKNFFWMASDKDVTDTARSGIDNLSRALDLDSPDSDGWDILAAFASDPTGDPDPQRKGVICSPGDPKYDADAAEALGKATGTMSSAWYYPVRPGVEVRSGPANDSPVVSKLGMHLIWVFPDDSPAAAVLTEVVRIVTPSGELGFVATDQIAPLPADLLCYGKEGNNWRIVGLVAGEPPQN
jgi:hypothetical protein